MQSSSFSYSVQSLLSVYLSLAMAAETATVIPALPTKFRKHGIKTAGLTTDLQTLLEDGSWLLPEQFSNDGEKHGLIVSPYITKPHILRLSTLDVVSQIISITLANLRPITPSYAITSYPNIFNWTELFTQYLPKFIDQQRLTIDPIWPIGSTKTFYVVYFRSTIQAGVDKEWLTQLDRESHAEAMESGGLLKYWFGSPDSERRNLATCVWRSPEDAIKGGKGPWHKQARAAAGRIYEKIEFTRLWLKLTRDKDRIEWAFEPVKD